MYNTVKIEQIQGSKTQKMRFAMSLLQTAEVDADDNDEINAIFLLVKLMFDKQTAPVSIPKAILSMALDRFYLYQNSAADVALFYIERKSIIKLVKIDELESLLLELVEV